MNAALLADLKGNALAGLTNAVLSCDLLLRSSLYGFQVHTRVSDPYSFNFIFS
jgi:hypothetical protein